MTNRRSILGFVEDYLFKDRLITTLISVSVTLLTVASLFAGVAVWPVVYSGVDEASALLAADAVKAVLTPVRTAQPWISLGCALLTLGYTVFKTGEVRFVNLLVISLPIGWGVYFALLMGGMAAFTALMQVGSMACILWFVLSLIMGYVLAFVPAVLIAGLMKVLHGAFRLLWMGA